MRYTVCQSRFLREIPIALPASVSNLTMLNGYVLPVSFASVCSLKKAKMGEPIMRNKYLNHEKYKAMRPATIMICPTMMRKFNQLEFLLSSHCVMPVVSKRY